MSNPIEMSELEFITFIKPLEHSMFRLAKRMLTSREEAQDAVGEITLKLWSKKESLGSVKNLEGYAMTMAKYYCLDRLKSKQGNHLRLVHVNYDKATDHLSTEIENRNSVSFIEKAMDGLPENQKLAIQLRDIEGLEFAQIQEILGMNPTAVRVALSRARKTLRELLLKQHAYGLTKN